MGVNFTQDDDDAAVATSEQQSSARFYPLFPTVYNVNDVPNDNILYLSVIESSTPNTSVRPYLSMIGDSLLMGTGVSDFSPNPAASFSDHRATDAVGPVIMKAEMVSSILMKITMSEEVDDNHALPLARNVFQWKVGSQKVEWIGRVIDFKEISNVSELTLEVAEGDGIPPGMVSTIAFIDAGVLMDDINDADGRSTNAADSTDTVDVTPPPAVEPEVAEEADVLPDAYSLSKNFPNPFNPTTTIQYAIPADGAGHVEMIIYNINGQKVRTLVNETKDAGYYSVVWDGRNDRGELVSSGIYLYRIVSGNFSKIERMTFIK
jgi:hypothetical protein